MLLYPRTALALDNLGEGYCSFSRISSSPTKKNWMPVMFFSVQAKRSLAVRIGAPVVIWILALVANLLTVPPTPSHAFLPCDIPKKCHSAATPKSLSCWQRLLQYLRFLYWLAAPSEK